MQTSTKTGTQRFHIKEHSMECQPSCKNPATIIIITCWYCYCYLFQISKGAIRAFAKEGKVPKITSDLLYCTRHGHSRKMKWKQNKHHLKGVGIYSVEESKKGVKLELSASLDHHLYTPIITSIKDSEIPNKYCFVMKVCSCCNVFLICGVKN